MVKSEQAVHFQQEQLQENEGLKLKKKKKKKHKVHRNDSNSQDITEWKTDTENNADETEMLDTESHKRKSKKKRKRDSENTAAVENRDDTLDWSADKHITESVTDESLILKKKRKKDKRHKIEDSFGETESVGENTKDDVCTDSQLHVVEEDKKCKKKKKRKNKVKDASIEEVVNGAGDEKDCNLYNDVDSSSLEANIVNKEYDDDCKKLKRKRQETCENNVAGGVQTAENAHLFDKGVEEMDTNKKRKKTKKEKRTESSQNHKLDNLDNRNVEHRSSKSTRDQKLSRDKNYAEGENTAAATTKGPSTGQWQTAKFEDTERQNKFIRLLGGFKGGKEKKVPKEKFDLTANREVKTVDSHKQPNMAMTKTQESLYKMALESQYEKAMDFNQNRGLGLGFQKPPKESKKFHIDIQKSKSVTFDD